MDDLNQDLNTLNGPENPITEEPAPEPTPVVQDSEIQPTANSESGEGATESASTEAGVEVAPSTDTAEAPEPEHPAPVANEIPVWMRSVDGDTIPIKCRCGRQLEKRDSHPDRYNAECPDPTCRLRYLVTDQGEEAVGRGI